MTPTILLALFACTGSSVEDPKDSASTVDTGVTNTTLDTDTDTTSPTDSVPTEDSAMPLGFVSGEAVDEEGQPLEDILVTTCRGSCISDNTDDQGWFLLPYVEPDDYPLSFFDLAGQYGVAVPLFMLTVGPGEDVVLTEPVVMPRLQPAAPMPEAPGDVEVVPGLTLTVDPDALWLAPWEPEGVLQGASPPAIPALVPFEGALAVWYLGPFKSISYTPMPLTLDNRWELAPGDTARAWVVSYLDAIWVDAGLMTVSDDGTVLTGAAIEELTTLVLVRGE